MIIFVGDWVRMHLESKWHQVVDIRPFDICVLDDGREVYAEDRPQGKIAEYLSDNEYKQLAAEWCLGEV
jgi:hypothetical protein